MYMPYAKVKATSRLPFVMNSRTALTFCHSCSIPGQGRVDHREEWTSDMALISSCMNMSLSRAKALRDPKCLEGFFCSLHTFSP